MPKKKIIPPIVVIIIIAAAIWYYNRSPTAAAEIELYGNVDIRQVSLAFNSSERIVEMLKEEGDTVIAGEILARLDTEILKLQIVQTRSRITAQEQAVLRLTNGTRPEEIEQQRAKTASAEAQLNQTSQDYKRLSGALKSSSGQAVSAQTVDEAQARLQVAQANLTEARKALDLALIGPRVEDIAQAQAELQALRAELAFQEHQLTLAELKTPLNAVVRSRLLEPGDMASPQRPVYLLAVNNPKWVRAYVKETDLGHVKPGQTAQVFIDSFPVQALSGQIGYISDVAEFTPKAVQTDNLRTSLLYEIRIYVQDPENLLRMGMPATVKIAKTANGK